MRSISEIKAMWERKALDAALPEDAVTHRDRQQRFLEIEMLLKALPRDQRVIDIGCGNGYSTALLAGYSKEVLGIDYSAAMIERARHSFGDIANLRFEVKDVMDLAPDRSYFDVAVCQRCLINLGGWNNQQKAIANIAAVLKPGGLFIMQEGTRQGREALNQARETVGLPRMPVVAFNDDFDEDTLWPFLRGSFDVVSVERTGMYDLISRVVHPLLVSPAEPKYDDEINEIARVIAAKIPGVGRLGREFSAVLRRREPGTPSVGS